MIFIIACGIVAVFMVVGSIVDYRRASNFRPRLSSENLRRGLIVGGYQPLNGRRLPAAPPICGSGVRKSPK